MRYQRFTFCIVASLLYFFFFGILLQYGDEISNRELSRYAFYITQTNYTVCFLIVLVASVLTGQSFFARLILIGTFVNLLAAIIYTLFHLGGGGDWASLWRLAGMYSPHFMLFFISNTGSHLGSEMIASNLERLKSFDRTEDISPNKELSIPEHLSREMQYAHGLLEQRASELRKSAAIAIFGIVAVLFASAVLFIFAGQIATLGTLRVDAYEEARTLHDRQSRRLEGAVQDLTSSLQALKGQPSTAAAFQQTLDRATSASESVKQALDQSNKLSDELRIMREKLIQAQIEGKKNIDVEFMLFSSVTRFGVLGIAAYLVYILVNLYRFNVLQSVFYTSIGDAILINGRIDLSNVEAIKAFRSDITFGNMHEKTLTSMLSEIRNLIANKDSNSQK